MRLLSLADPTLEESYRRATTQEPIIEGGSLVSPGLASQRDRFLTAKAGYDCLNNATVENRPDAVGWAHPSWAGPLTTSLRGLWVSGYLPRAMADRAQGRRPDNRPGGDDSDPGLASRRERGLNCHQNGVLSNQRGLHQFEKGQGAQRPHCAKGRDPRTPASWRHFLLRVVAATASAQWSVGWGYDTTYVAYLLRLRSSFSPSTKS